MKILKTLKKQLIKMNSHKNNVDNNKIKIVTENEDKFQKCAINKALKWWKGWN